MFMTKITAKMKIGEVVNKYPETMEVFFKHELHCVGCAVAQFESIEQGAKAHGIDVKKLIDDLNKVFGVVENQNSISKQKKAIRKI